MITTMMYHTAFILALVVLGFDAAAWFSFGMVFMFWLVAFTLSRGDSQ